MRHSCLTFGLALVVTFAASSCGLGPKVLLVVSLQTDLIAGFEFTRVRTFVGDAVEIDDAGSRNFIDPVRVAELRSTPGNVRVRVQLLDAEDHVIAERLILAEVRRDTGVVAFISSSCRGVLCEGADDTCIRRACRNASSVCGDATCRPGGTRCEDFECDPPERFCPLGVCDDDCVADTDCTNADGCSDMFCESSVCVGVPREGACPPGRFCAVGLGCADVPPGVLYDGGVARDGDVARDGGDNGNGDASTDQFCVPCTTSCGTNGLGVCVGGFPTGECVPPTEMCNGEDEDCDARVDEGLECGHQHNITCQLGNRPVDGGGTEENHVDRIGGGGPGLVCAGGVCTTTLTNCQTLPAGADGHRHVVQLGGADTLTIADDTPFAVIATVEPAADPPMAPDAASAGAVARSSLVSSFIGSPPTALIPSSCQQADTTSSAHYR